MNNISSINSSQYNNYSVADRLDNNEVQENEVLENGVEVQDQENAVSEDSPKAKKSALKSIADYFEPRETTSGDLPYSSPKRAAVAGGLKGFLSMGASGAVAGAAGGYAGVRVGEETGSMSKALAAGAAVGAGTLLVGSAVLSGSTGVASGAGLMAVSGAVAGGTSAAIKHIEAKSEKEINPTVKKLAPIAAGVASGAAIGAIGGPASAVAGAVVGGVSSMLSEPVSDENSTIKSSLLSATVSAGAGAVAGGMLAAGASANPALALTNVGAVSLMGGLTGASSVISGSSSGDVRDSSETAFAAAALTNAFTGVGGGAANMAASIGGAVGSRIENPVGKVLASAGAGGAVGALGGSFAGPVGAAIGATVGAGTAVAGAVAGPKIQQGIRNFTEDVQNFIKPATEKFSGFIIDKLGEVKGLAVVGALTGAMSSAILGITAGALFGPIGAAAVVGAGALLGGSKFASIGKDITGAKQVISELKANGPSLEDINNYMCQSAFKQIEGQLGDMSLEDKKALYSQLVTQSMAELKSHQKEIDAIYTNVGNAIYQEMKQELSDIKGKDEKQKYISSQLGEAKGPLTQGISQNIIAMLQAEQQQAQQQQVQ